MIDLATFLGVLVLLGFGAWWVATLDELVTGWMAGRPLGRVAVRPLQRAAALLIQQQNETERPDLLNWKLAPALYLALAGVGLAVVPFAPEALWWKMMKHFSVVAHLGCSRNRPHLEANTLSSWRSLLELRA